METLSKDIKSYLIQYFDLFASMQTCREWFALIDQKFDYSFDDQLPLRWNAIKNNMPAIKKLLTKSNVAPSHSELFYWAIWHHNLEMAKLFIHNHNFNTSHNEINDFKYNKKPDHEYTDMYKFFYKGMKKPILQILTTYANWPILKLVLAHNPKIVQTINLNNVAKIMKWVTDDNHPLLDYIGRVYTEKNEMILFYIHLCTCDLDGESEKFINEYLTATGFYASNWQSLYEKYI
jgi:hypothetical protein